MRQLRHDFRHYYHCCYDQVDSDEALDLIFMLPQGTRFRASQNEVYSWSDLEHFLANIQDAIYQLACFGSGIPADEIPRVTRPVDIAARKKAHEKRIQARKRIENTQWKEG